MIAAFEPMLTDGVTIYDPAMLEAEARRVNEVESAPAATPLERVRELEHFALERLPALQLSDGVFCHEVSAEGAAARGPLAALHPDRPDRAAAGRGA